MAIKSTPAGFLGSQNNAYSLLSVMAGHIGPITCLSATDDGKLASGGMDGVRLWHIGNSKELGRPSGAGQRGATTALAWIRREDEPDDGLIYGTANGFLICWKETRSGENFGPFEETCCVQLAKPGEVTGIAFEAGSNRLATSNRNSVIQVFLTDSRMELHPIFSIVINNHVPKAIAFGQVTGEHKDVLTFGLHDGLIGNAAVNSRRGVFCVDDPLQGTALYRLDSGARIRTYPVAVERSMRPRQVTFAEDCRVIISGSDHGVVYIFDRRSGEVVDKLKIGDDRVQAISAMETTETRFVLSAISHGKGDASDIVVWQKNTDKVVQQRTKEDPNTWSGFRVIVHVCLWLVSIAFISQNIGKNAIFIEKVMDYVGLI